MSEKTTVPPTLRYTKSHEWLREEKDGLLTVGITEHAQQLLGEVVYVDLPELEHESEAGDDIAVLESVKAAADVYAPVQGKIVAVNDTLSETPDLVNNDSYEAGWLFKIEPSDKSAVAALMDADSYQKEIEQD